MEFAEILEQTIALLQHQGRISYGALKRRFGLHDAYLDDVKIELIEAQQLARDENGRILVWAGQSVPAPPLVPESAFPRPSPQGTPEALPYSILRRLSSTSQSHVAPCAAWRRGAPAGLPRGAGWPAARALGGFRGALPRTQKVLWNSYPRCYR